CGIPSFLDGKVSGIGSERRGFGWVLEAVLCGGASPCYRRIGVEHFLLRDRGLRSRGCKLRGGRGLGGWLDWGLSGAIDGKVCRFTSHLGRVLMSCFIREISTGSCP